MVRVSVAMCTYNGERHLPEQLNSILEQTLLPWEVVVCDDRSSDATMAILRNFARNAPFPVHVIRNTTTLGSTGNFEQCIQMCGGDAIALADQDDLWVGHKLQNLVGMLEHDPTIGAIFSDATLINARSKPTGEALWQRMLFTPDLQARLSQGDAAGVLLQTPVVTGATMIFRTWLRDYALPIPEPWVHDAWIAWIAVISSRLVSTSERLTKYRLHGFQQLGLPAHSRAQGLRSYGARYTLRAARDQEVKRYSRFALEYAILRRFILRRRMGSQKIHIDISRKTAFSEFIVSNLARPRLQRLLESLLRVPDYRQLTPHRALTIVRHSLL